MHTTEHTPPPPPASLADLARFAARLADEAAQAGAPMRSTMTHYGSHGRSSVTFVCEDEGLAPFVAVLFGLRRRAVIRTGATHFETFTGRVMNVKVGIGHTIPAERVGEVA